MFKNVSSQKVIFFAFDATTNVPKTGDAANITPYVSKDFGAVTAMTDTSATEMDATNAPGYYLVDISQTESNADVLLLSAKSSTSNIKVLGAPATIFTYPTTGILAPATAGRTLVVDASGLADATAVKIGPSGSGTAQTARDIGASVLLSSGTGTGQLSITSGIAKVDVDTIKTNPVVNAGTITFPTTATLASTTNITAATGIDVTKWNGTTVATPATAGIPDVNVKNAANVAWASGAITAAVLANASIDLATFAADVGNLSNRSGTAQAGGASTITLDSGASAVDNFYKFQICQLTGGTGAGQTNSIASYIGSTKVATMDRAWATNPDNTTTFALLLTSPLPSATALTGAQIATAVFTDTTAGDFTVANSVGKSIMNGVSLGTGLTVAAVSGAVGSVTGAVGSVTGAVGSVTGAVGSVAGNIGGDLQGTLTVTERNAIATATLARSLAAESYAADGAVPTLSQVLYLIQQTIGDFAISGTTISVKKLDGSTEAATYVLDSAVLPTSRTRAT